MHRVSRPVTTVDHGNLRTQKGFVTSVAASRDVHTQQQHLYLSPAANIIDLCQSISYVTGLCLFLALPGVAQELVGSRQGGQACHDVSRGAVG